MKKCALCLCEKTLKKNTHYLSHFIINTALNEDGNTKRGKTFSFDMSSDTPFTKLNFKRATNTAKVEEALGRKLTDQEIEESKMSPDDFAADETFCQECEDKFTVIENKFSTSSIVKMRYNKSLENIKEIEIKELALFRIFWLLQVWRTSVCLDYFKLSPRTSEKLRLIILQGLEAPEEELKQFPLAVTFLYSGEDKLVYTNNFVSASSDTKPNLILMNDFVIQFYEVENDVNFFNYCGLNHKKDYLDFINLEEEIFKVKVFSDERRVAFLEAFYVKERVFPFLEFLRESFYKRWLQETGVPPSRSLLKEYGIAITRNDGVPIAQHTSEERITQFTNEFIAKKLGLL